MVGMRGEAEILKAFEGLDRAPGSKQPRREPSSVSEKRRAKILGESNGWDANPIIKRLGGEDTEVFTIGALALALEKQIVTIEGNTSAGASQRNGGEVMVKSRALGARSFVVGYGRPAYESFSGDLPDRPKGEK
jgi:hypothetical protein